MKIIITLFIAVLLSATSVFSDSYLSESGSAGMSFLSIAPTASIASLGGGATAYMTGASSLWSNPSLIALEEERTAQFTHTEWLEGIKQEYAVFSTKIDYGTIGLGALLFDSGNIDGRDDYGNSTGDYGITNAALSISYAGKVHEWIALGVTYKKLFQKVSDETAGGYAFDAGLTAITPVQGLRFAAAGRNYGKMGKLMSTTTDLPSNISVGFLYSDTAPGLEKTYTVLADVIFPRYGDTGFRFGIEMDTIEYLVLRIGYRNDSDFEDMIYGVGFDWCKITADISYSALNNVSDDAFRFTLSIIGF
ncbi:PorV/PorQ family protein [Candidatus Latescibacterota bacterium]